ncbi:phosphatase PAP2 family protein [Kocuria rhizosphaericola]|uniref:phosphatase PAP2 family protein n=1 Tax=Kocuria rhizosphaericola TaxID=3376284 RepID=UPI0037A5A9BA
MSHPAQHSSPRPARSTWSLPQLHQWVVVPFIVVLVTATVGRLLVYSPGVAAQETEVLHRLDAARLGVLDALALVLHHAFSTPGALAIVAALTAWLALARRRPWDAAGFAVTALSGWAAVRMVQVAVGRPRPDGSAFPEPLVLVEGLTSFPSGHAGAAVAIAAAFGLAVRRSRFGSAALVAGLGTAVLVGLSRLYLGVHYPLDVLASFPVAWAGLAVGCGLANHVVPALAYGFGWQQQDAAWHDVDQAPVAEESLAEDARPDTARMPVVARRTDHHAA